MIDRWAGLRPKAMARDPLVGPLPDAERIIALTGGFKVSFGIAHRLADAALQSVLGFADVDIPPSFECPIILADTPSLSFVQDQAILFDVNYSAPAVFDALGEC